MAPALQLRYAGDPRRPEEIKKYDVRNFTPEDYIPDAYILFGLVFGMAALLMKYRWAALLSIACSLVAMANSRGTENEWKQIISTITVAGFALFQTYIEVPVPVSQAT